MTDHWRGLRLGGLVLGGVASLPVGAGGSQQIETRSGIKYRATRLLIGD